MKTTLIKQTPFGSVGIVWSLILECPKITRVILSKPDLPAEAHLSAYYPGLAAGSCAEIDKVTSKIRAILEREVVEIPIDTIDLNHCPPFQQYALRAIRKIPRGTVSTYQLIALKLDKPGAARAVGNAMAHNPFPIIIPCHRTIRTDGTLGGYQGGITMKRRLLEMEGADID